MSEPNWMKELESMSKVAYQARNKEEWANFGFNFAQNLPEFLQLLKSYRMKLETCRALMQESGHDVSHIDSILAFKPVEED